MGRRGKFRMRIRKMKPEPITRTRTVKRLAWGKSEKKEETVLGTLLVSLICFQIFCINRKNNYEESDDEDSVPTTDPEQVQIGIQGDNHAPGSVGDSGPFSSTIFDGSPVFDSAHGDPNLIRVLEYVQSSSTHEHLRGSMSSPLPGAVGESDPPSSFVGGRATVTISAPASLPYTVQTQSHPLMTASENNRDPAPSQEPGLVLDSGDLELTSLPSCESLHSASNEQKKESDKKQTKKDKKKKRDSKKKESKAKQAAEKKKKSPKMKNDSSSKIPTVKEWAKQEEKKKKADKKQQKKELKQEKKKQKQMDKQVAKAEKQKKAQNLKEEKDLKKAEKEAAKAKKSAEKAEKAATKAKEAAAKAEAKKKEKMSKWEDRMQRMMDKSDKQMAADLEKGRRKVEEHKRKQEDEAREMMKSVAKTEITIKILQEKLERKEKRVAQLNARRDRSGHISMLVAFKLNYKITDYNRRIHSINSVINKLQKKVEAKQKEVERLAPHLLRTEVSTETQEDEAIPCSSNSNDADHTDDVADNDSILDILSYFDSESECSDDEEEELPSEGSTHSNVQEILRKAQESLQKMDEASYRLTEGSCHSEDEPGYVGKGKGPANGRKTVTKCL